MTVGLVHGASIRSRSVDSAQFAVCSDVLYPVHGDFIFHTPRAPRLPDGDTGSVWCGHCRRWLTFEFPEMTPDERIAVHQEVVELMSGRA